MHGTFLADGGPERERRGRKISEVKVRRNREEEAVERKEKEEKEEKEVVRSCKKLEEEKRISPVKSEEEV